MATGGCKTPSVLAVTLITALCCFNIDCATSDIPNCAVSITINSSIVLSFNQTDNLSTHSLINCTLASNLSVWETSWYCIDLQSALSALEDLSQSTQDRSFDLGNGSSLPNQSSTLDTGDCVSLFLPAGEPHYITAPLFLGNLSVYFTGISQSESLGNRTSESILQRPSVICDYTVDVDLERIFEPDYEYIDYVLYFNRSKAVVFDNLEIINCPYPVRLNTVDKIIIRNSTFGNFSEAVFDLYNCHSILITMSTFHDNMGTGISRYEFRANTGAVAIGFNGVPLEYSIPEVLINNCNFTRNRATASALFRSSSAAFFNRAFSGRGGGVGVFFNEDIHNVSVSIADNFFQDNFARSFGGAVFLVIFNESTHHTVHIQRNIFHSNVGLLGGGAIQMTFISNGIVGNPHMTLFTDCQFVNNSGASGGAVYVYPAFEGGDGNFVKFERCHFLDNHGVDGLGEEEFGAVLAISFSNFFRNKESLPRHEIIDCVFEGNTGSNGIVSIAYAPVKFSGNNTFIGNRGTSALRIVASLVEFYDSLSFVNNSVGDVAALHLLSFGQIRLTSQLNISFSGNIGSYGASILVGTPTAVPAFRRLAFNPQCFIINEDTTIPPSLWKDVSVTFRHNQAVLGSSLYMSDVGTCSWFSLTPPFFDTSYIKQWPIWDFGNDSVNRGFEEPYSPDYHVETAAVAIDSANDSVTFWPGHRFNIFLTGWDQFNHPTAVSARFYSTSNFTKDKLRVNINPAVVITDSDPNAGGVLTRNYALSYTVSNGDFLAKKDDPLATVRVDVPFEDVDVLPDNFLIYSMVCPPGYSLSQTTNNQGMECRCDDNIPEVLTCADDQDTVLIQSGYWVSNNVSSQGSKYIYPCPADYCSCSQETSLGPTMCVYAYKISEPDAQCACNRQGVLCGECQYGLGVSSLLNSCVSCDNAFAVLIVLLIILDAIIFVLIALWDTSLPAWLFPLIFYLQMAPYVAQYFPESFQIVGKYLYFVGSALSFYFPYDFCLYQNMDPLFSYFLRYVPLLVAMAMCPLLAFLRRSRWKVLDHYGLWWIVLLLYTQVVHTSLSILNCPYIETLGEYRWFVNGSVQCFSGWHTPIGLLAILMLLLCFAVVPLTVIIVFHKYPRRGFYWLRTLAQPLKNSYKKQWKWWFAVELGRRLAFLLLFVPLPRNNAIHLILVCVMVAVYGMVQPYKNTTANILEVIVLVNFLFLLMLQTTQQIVDDVFLFPTSNKINFSNSTVENCSNKYSGVSYLTWLLLPFYYLPLLLLVVIGIGYIIYLIRQRIQRSKRKAALNNFHHNGSSKNSYVPPGVKFQSIRLGSRRGTHGVATAITRLMRYKNGTDVFGNEPPVAPPTTSTVTINDESL